MVGMQWNPQDWKSEQSERVAMLVSTIGSFSVDIFKVTVHTT